MKKVPLILGAVLALLALGAAPSFSQVTIPDEKGFSGFVRFNLGYLAFKSNMASSWTWSLSARARRYKWG